MSEVEIIRTADPMAPFKEAIDFINAAWPYGCMEWAGKNLPGQLEIVYQLETQINDEVLKDSPNQKNIERLVMSWRSALINIMSAYRRTL